MGAKKKPSVLRIDMAGERIGMLKVIAFAGRMNRGGTAAWDCLCDCGKTVRVRGCDLRAKRKYSCGCRKKPKHWHLDARGNYGLERLAKTIQAVRRETEEIRGGKGQK